MSDKRKRNIITVLLLLSVALVIFFLLCKKKNEDQKIAFVLQGTTTLPAGKISMKIWDNNTEDGDSVRVYLDNKLIKDSVALLYEPLEIDFGSLAAGEHTLGVVAINEGMNAPATATIGFGNDSKENNFEMNATKDSAAAWKLVIQ